MHVKYVLGFCVNDIRYILVNGPGACWLDAGNKDRSQQDTEDSAKERPLRILKVLDLYSFHGFLLHKGIN